MAQELTFPGEVRAKPDRPRVPRSTYRLQFNRDFTFRQAIEITEYLNELGISDCYASPIFRARPGSSHGYDVCDFNELNPTIGTQGEFDRWAGGLRDLGMGLVLDMVPNHMSADPSNPWWRDVLKNGEASAHAQWFDIDWRAPDPKLHDKVLLPILEDHYSQVLEAGKLKIVFEEDGFVLRYHQTTFPLSPESLAFLHTEESDLGTINGTVGVPASFDQLHALLQRQHYQLAYWRLDHEQINYRRFFDVSELVSLRMELPEVFNASHNLLVILLREGKITGLRVDHPDGLWNPKQYLTWLQSCSQRREEAETHAESGNAPVYVVVEKILGLDEALPPDWPVDGTTGYEFLNRLNGLFVNAASRGFLNDLYYEFAGIRTDFKALVRTSKKKILRTSMRNDLRGLTRLLTFVASRTRYGMDFGWRELTEALVEIIASFPVYRTYLTEETETPTPQEQVVIQEAMRRAEIENQVLDPAVLAFIEGLLLLSPPVDLDETGQMLSRRFVMRFQQLSGPVMAKGLEDTAFYNFNRLISLNEVGGDPGQFGTSLESFHEHNGLRAEQWPHSLLATATHDTKRGEDARARLNVLSEMPEQWRQAVFKWSRLNAMHKTQLDGFLAPDANDEYFLYQTLIGAWCPAAESADGHGAFLERISNHMLKAIRESKAHTNWTEPNAAYENATRRFVESLLATSAANAFLDDFMLFHRKVAFFGLFNSLAQVALKMTAPGVPDFYQGTELWDFNLVDPDNRRPVDYQTRKQLLSELRGKLFQTPVDLAAFMRGLLQNYQTGQIKLYLIWRILGFRRTHQALFENGAYVPLFAVGLKRDHICAFARTSSQGIAITVAARFVLGLAKGAEGAAIEPDAWQDTVVPLPTGEAGGRYRNVVTQQIIEVCKDGSGLPVKEVLGLLPVALLERVDKE